MQSNLSEPRIRQMGNWKVHEWTGASSTNDLARDLPPWSIARCDIQTNGRGRFNRPWIGAQGGLWSSFTVPLDGGASVNWGHLPLVAGLCVLDLLESYHIDARLRWPNDVLVGDAKLAGILVERPSPAMAVIGIGVNVANDVDAIAGIVKDPVTSILKLTGDDALDASTVMEQLADRIRQRYLSFKQGGLVLLLPDLQAAWKVRKTVAIQTDEADVTGIFVGIDDIGNPLIEDKTGGLTAIPAHTVNRLVEN